MLRLTKKNNISNKRLVACKLASVGRYEMLFTFVENIQQNLCENKTELHIRFVFDVGK